MILVVHLGEVKDRKDRMEIHCFPDTGKCEIHDWFPNGESAGISKCSITRLRELMHAAIAESRKESELPQPPKESSQPTAVTDGKGFPPDLQAEIDRRMNNQAAQSPPFRDGVKQVLID